MTPTPIEWTDLRWNPTRGCRRTSPGCGGAAGEGGCYAERQAYRFSGPGLPYEGLVTLGKNGPRWTGKGRVIPDTLGQPLSWKKPARVFVDSMSDLFFEAFSNEEIAAVFGVMAACPHLTFQVLTKRAKRMREWFEWVASVDLPLLTLRHAPKLVCAVEAQERLSRHWTVPDPRSWPLPNVWLGVSVENQEYADERIPLLLGTPAAVRFISAEPLLGPLTLLDDRGWLDGIAGGPEHASDCNGSCEGCPVDGRFQVRSLDWVIVGGESGPGARPFHVEWARSIVQQCHAADAAVFVKQLGAHVRWDGTSVPGEHWPTETTTEDDGRGGWRVHLRDKKGGDLSEFPEDLRVREFPTTGAA